MRSLVVMPISMAYSSGLVDFVHSPDPGHVRRPPRFAARPWRARGDRLGTAGLRRAARRDRRGCLRESCGIAVGGRARLDAGEPRHLSWPRHRRPRVGFRRHAPGRGAEHRNLTADDIVAMTTYLLGDKPPSPAPPPAVDTVAAVNEAGRTSYVALCAGCHGLDGRGIPNTIVPLRNNSTLRLADPRNLIVATLDGIGPQNFPHRMTCPRCPVSPTSSATSRLRPWSTTCALPGAARNRTSRPPRCVRCAEPSFAGILLASAQADPQRVVSRAAFLRPTARRN
jgi:hypothetical protein